MSAARSAFAWIALAANVAVPLHIAWRIMVAALGGGQLALIDAVIVAAAYASGVIAGHVVTRVSS